MNRSPRWSVAFGAGILLSLGLLSPVATATAGVSQVSVPSTSAPSGEYRSGLGKSLPRQIFERAIDPGQYECGPTAFDAYIDEVLSEFTDAQWDFLEEHPDAFDVPTYDALIFGTSTDPFYGFTSHGAQVKNSFRDVKKFWDIDSADIQLLAMHGASNLDAARISRTLSFLYEVPESVVATYAQEIADFFNAAGPAFYDNPIFTLNAFAFSGEGQPDPAVAAIPDKLVFGDGFLDAMDAMGLGDVGPRVVMGHEFGHHIQYEQHLFVTNPPLPGPEATRRTELMADAMAGYFGVHKNGLALNAKRVVDAIMTFYVVGDCQFTSNGHHGTPNQRERAATWGTEMAMAAQPKSYVLGSLAFADLFEEKLPEFIAPDA